MIIVTEQNYLEKNRNLKVLRTENYIPDEEYEDKMRKIMSLARKKKREKIDRLTCEMNGTKQLIQYYQKLALITDDNREALTHLEYVQMILMPSYHRLQREITALENSLSR